MTSIGIPGRRGFELHKEMAKELPHKWTAQYLYRDFLRVLIRKYDEPQLGRLKKLLRKSFVEHSYINDELKMNAMGSGPTSLGSLAIEEEFFQSGRKHPEHASRFDMVDSIGRAMDCQTWQPLPYLVQRDLWYYFGLGEAQQNTLATKCHKIAADYAEEYQEETAEERDRARQWLLRRLDCFEDSVATQKRTSDKTTVSVKDEEFHDDIHSLFAFLDSDSDGVVTYKDYVRLLQSAENAHSSTDRVSDELMYTPDDMHLYAEGWYYMCDVMGIAEERYSSGWTVAEFQKAYLVHGFFDLDYHCQCMEIALNKAKLRSDEAASSSSSSSSESSDDSGDDESDDALVHTRKPRMYNLYCDVAFGGVVSAALIVKHNIASGYHLYGHISNPDDDKDMVTWEKLKQIHDKMGTPEAYQNAYETREVVPEDILWFDPDEHKSEIVEHLPEDYPMWAVVFEARLEDIDDQIADTYLTQVVKKRVTAVSATKSREAYKRARNKLIEDYVFDKIESAMQPWLWSRYLQSGREPRPFAIRTLDYSGEKNLSGWFSLLKAKRSALKAI